MTQSISNISPLPSRQLSDYDYTLPSERIAQVPLAQRDQSRLLVLNRADGSIEHKRFTDLPGYLHSSDLLVLNNTRVTAKRLFGFRPNHAGERLEVFLIERISPSLWRGLVRPGKKLLPGVQILFGEGLQAEVLERTDARGGRLLHFTKSGVAMEADEAISRQGAAPLPPYITQALDPADRERYQTVYAAQDGSAAAPTAGLHFTPHLLQQIEAKGVQQVQVTLHVGIGTFRPIQSDDISEHIMHPEQVTVSQQAAAKINRSEGRIIAVGTTSTRTLESAAVGDRRIQPLNGETCLYVTPGYHFQIVDALITNFHMPRSTLLVLVSAFAGRELILEAYHEALKEGYRFLSFGDAMLIL